MPVINTELLLKKYQQHHFFEEVQLTRFDQKGLGEESPLHVACHDGNLEEVMCMLNTELDINVRGDIGSTPLHEAVSAGHVGIVKLLLNRGADSSILDDYEDSPLDVAISLGNIHIVNLLR